MSTYLVTGAAGFIASKVCEMLLAEGHTVVGVDNLNDYYDVRLKYYRLARLAELSGCEASQVASLKDQVTRSDPQVSGFKFQVSALKSDRFEFHTLDIEDLPALERVFARSNFDAVFNLAARAGVRYSLENPHVYLSTNTLGTLNILECQRKYGVKKQVLASTSSLYAGCPMPFTEDQPVNTPLSPYAATKKAAEMLAYSYHKLYGLDISVVRYFTVFGPAGRPDMAPLRFIKWIDEGTPITLYGDGTQSRDFTYVDDIARGTILAGQLFGGRRLGGDGEAKLAQPKAEGGKLKAEVSGTKSGSGPESSGFRSQVSGFPDVAPSYDAARQRGDGMTAGHAPDAGLAAGGVDAGGNPEGVSGYNIINLGGGRNPISLHTVIGFIEKALGKKAKIDGHPFQAVDMKETWADITKAERLLGWKPEVSPELGFQRSVDWHVANREWLRGIKP